MGRADKEWMLTECFNSLDPLIKCGTRRKVGTREESKGDRCWGSIPRTRSYVHIPLHWYRSMDKWIGVAKD